MWKYGLSLHRPAGRLALMFLLTISLACEKGSTLTCGETSAIEEISMNPPSPLAVGENSQIGVRVRYPPKDALFRWRTENGACEPQETRSLSTTYTARRAGTDTIRLEVLSAGAVVMQKEIEILVLAANPPKTRETPEAAATSASSPPSPTIHITAVPPYDEVGGGTRRASIAGVVTGASPGQRVVLYACTNACYVQPLIAAPNTEIHPDGTWENWTYTGKEYVALLVDSRFEPEPVIPGIRQNMTGVIAREIVTGVRESAP
jgi:hypothetical protein